MSFINVSFTPRITYDNDYFNRVIQLQETGAAFKTNHVPTLRPAYEGGEHKRLPFAFLILEWTYIIYSNEEEEVLHYFAEDKFQINPHQYTHQDVREAVAKSFDRMANYFRGYMIAGGYLEMEDVGKDEFEDLSNNVSRFLRGHTG